MKGFTHFISGMAVASFFEQAVHMASQESSFILCLGGLFGILPDTLDFKLAKYFYKSDVEIKPDPNNLDAREIANGIAKAVNKAIETGKGSAQLHTMQLASNRWRSYQLRFDTKTSEICVDIGPEVDTGQIPFDGTELNDPEKAHARVKVNCEFYQQFDKVSNIAIMTGPCFEFEKREDGKMEIVFLPWHRQWSHSFTLGMLIAFIVGIISYLVIGPDSYVNGYPSGYYWLPKWSLYPLIILFGSMVHIIEDSTGFMGNNLFYPFTKKRTDGLGFMSASEGIPNFLFVWTAVICIIFNLDRFRWNPNGNVAAAIANPFSFWFWFYIVPVAIMIYFFLKGKKEKALQAKENGTSEKTVDFDGPQAVESETDASII